MHPFQLRRLMLVALAATLLLAVPSEAKRRSVGKGSSGSSTTADVNATVLDNATGLPVIGAKVQIGRTSKTTDEQGKVTFKDVKGTTVTVEASRTGYNPNSAQVTLGGTQNVTVRLNPRPTVQVRKLDGTVIALDDDSVEFGYPVAFSGYLAAPFEDFCRADGSVVEVDRSEIARINGNATPAQFAACCPNAGTLKINITLKNGQTSDYYFVDACNGYINIEVLGRDHVSGAKVFVPVGEIAEVVFP